jgi:oligopeptide transport system substrate-binding protein
VRRALSLAVDRTALSQNVLNGAFLAAPTMVPPACGDYVSTAKVTRDLDTARRLLAEAGFPGGKGLPSIPVQVLNDENQPRVMEALQAIWLKELGVKITIEPFEQKTLFQNQQNLQHTLAVLGWTGDYADASTFLDIFRTGNGQNWTGWGNKDFDALLDQAARTTDPLARLTLFQKAEALLLDQAPISPLLHRARTYLIHPSVKNWAPAPLGTRRFQLIRLEK